MSKLAREQGFEQVHSWRCIWAEVMLAGPAGRKCGVPLWEIPQFECGRFAAMEPPGDFAGSCQPSESTAGSSDYDSYYLIFFLA